MNATELLQQARQEGHDEVTPYMWSDALLIRLFNEAVDEACRRKDLLFDDVSVGVCQIDISEALGGHYWLDESVRTIVKAYIDYGDYKKNLTIVSRPEVDQLSPDWRDLEAGEPDFLVQDEGRIQLIPAPLDTATLRLEVWRVPMSPELLEATPAIAGTPYIASIHHRYLYHWVLAKAYMIDDLDSFNPEKAARHDQAFIDYFGLPRDASLLRETRMNLPRRNKVW